MTTTPFKRLSTISEAFENRKFKAGTVKFSTTDIKDPHIVKAIGAIVAHSGLTRQEIEKTIDDKVKEFEPIAKKAPTLYNTIVKNIVEDTVFNLMEDHQTSVAAAPRYDRAIFYKLIRRIKAEHDMFSPMRSFLNHKHLYEAVIIFVPENQKYKKVTTAAASPKGEFIFNEIFMQHLIDFAHLKEVKPQGKKYKCNDGDIPDEYCYIEFLIIHEFMHYVYDDFHYSKMIKRTDGISNKTHNDIINWVGDFRTNYLLVKSGYEQLPMGLFNDQINYDRQSSYIEMYNLVKAEIERLDDDERGKVEEGMPTNDDHELGNDEAEDMEEGEGEEETDKIDEHQRKVERAMTDSRDLSPKEAREFNDKQKQREDRTSSNTGAIRDTRLSTVNYKNKKPKFNWKELIEEFLNSAEVTETEESYQLPSRRSISSIHTAVQLGAGAMKAGEIISNLSTSNLAFCIDSSGSMSHMIETVYSNIDFLLNSKPALQNAEITLLRFSGTHEMYKAIFAGDRAAKVSKVDEVVYSFPLKLSTVFKQHRGDNTNLTPDLINDLSKLLLKGYNLIMFSDSDITNGENFDNLKKLLRITTGKIFIIFDDSITYKKFKDQIQGGNVFVTYFKNVT